jgi:hypothetical protein
MLISQMLLVLVMLCEQWLRQLAWRPPRLDALTPAPATVELFPVLMPFLSMIHTRPHGSRHGVLLRISPMALQ